MHVKQRELQGEAAVGARRHATQRGEPPPSPRPRQSRILAARAAAPGGGARSVRTGGRLSGRGLATAPVA